MTVKQISVIVGYRGHDRNYTNTPHTIIFELIKPKYFAEYSNRSGDSWFNRLTIFEHGDDYFICKGEDKSANDIFTGISAIYSIEFMINYLTSNISEFGENHDTVEYLQFLKAHIRVLNIDKLLKDDTQYC